VAEVPQKSLERYDVLDRIAVGGMAEVFLAKAYGAHGFEKTLAIKRILPELARDHEFEERFIAEAKVAVRLSHTNVVQVFDFGRFAGSLFIAMEYVDGLDMAALLRRHKELGRLLPVPAAFHIGVELARGLDFAHQHGVVHRDVSPSNILLSRAGEVKIADFGIAVAARPERPKPGAKRKVMGKWRYMSPEQARGEPVDPRSDIFSMAVVMYELFTGEKLFPGDEVEEIVRNIHDMPLPRPSEIRRDLPKRIDDILLPALSRDPARRPTRAAILQRSITELSYESSIVATALDVADAVALALDLQAPPSASGKHSLDLLLRQQIAENLGKGGTADGRRTALTTNQHSTAITASKLYRDKDGAPLVITREAIILGAETGAAALDGPDGDDEGGRDRITEPVQLQALGDETTGRALLERRVDPDGITHLELDENTMARLARAGRKGSRSEASAGDEADHLTRADTPSAKRADTPAAATAPPRRAPRVALVVAAVAAVGALIVWLAVRGPGAAATPDAARAMVIDAGPTAPAPAMIDLTSEPPGARGTVGDVAVAATPARVTVPAGVPQRVRLELAGYRAYVDDGVVVQAGQVVRIVARMVPARASLRVDTEPPGATVELGGRVIGETPLVRDDLPPGGKTSLTITKPGFEPVKVPVELALDAPVEVSRTLAPIERFGLVDVYVEEGWGDVFWKGKNLGRAPKKGIRLPVGRHALRIVNPVSKQEATVSVVVKDGETAYYRVKLQ
jgi:serine/threonine protein kinase